MGHEAKSACLRGLFLAIVLELMLVPAILYWPQFEQNVGKLRALTPLPVLKQMVTSLEEGGVFAYVAGQHFFKGCNILGAVAAVLFGMGIVAGEAHRGTLEVWLARPLPRWRLLSERYLAGALALVVPMFATTCTIPWLLTYVRESVPLQPYLWAAAHESCFVLAIYSAAVLWSSVGRRPMAIAIGMLFFTILQFSLYLVERVTHWSLIRLVDIEVLMRLQAKRELDLRLVLPMMGFSALAFGLSQVAFHRRVP